MITQIPEWWKILVGILIILLGISIWIAFGIREKNKVNLYKDQQLKAYKKQNPKFKGTYKEAKLILPWSQRMRLTWVPIVGLALVIIGFSISTGIVFGFFTR